MNTNTRYSPSRLSRASSERSYVKPPPKKTRHRAFRVCSNFDGWERSSLSGYSPMMVSQPSIAPDDTTRNTSVAQYRISAHIIVQGFRLELCLPLYFSSCSSVKLRLLPLRPSACRSDDPDELNQPKNCPLRARHNGKIDGCVAGLLFVSGDDECHLAKCSFKVDISKICVREYGEKLKKSKLRYVHLGRL